MAKISTKIIIFSQHQTKFNLYSNIIMIEEETINFNNRNFRHYKNPNNGLIYDNRNFLHHVNPNDGLICDNRNFRNYENPSNALICTDEPNCYDLKNINETDSNSLINWSNLRNWFNLKNLIRWPRRRDVPCVTNWS